MSTPLPQPPDRGPSRTVATERQALQRLVEYLGGALELKSHGRTWRMKWLGRKHPHALVAQDVLGRLVLYLTHDHGWTFLQVWNACGFDPGKHRAQLYGVWREIWQLAERGWVTGEVRKMLNAYEEATP